MSKVLDKVNSDKNQMHRNTSKWSESGLMSAHWLSHNNSKASVRTVNNNERRQTARRSSSAVELLEIEVEVPGQTYTHLVKYQKEPGSKYGTTRLQKSQTW